MTPSHFRKCALVVCLALAGGAAAQTGSEAEARARDFRTLTEAAAAGDEARVRELLERGVDAHHPPESSETEAQYHASLGDPVHAAAAGGHAGVLRTLLEHGANPEWMGCSGETALVEAAEGGYDDAVRVLLQGGADPWAMGEHGPPLLRALTTGHYRTASLLVIPTLLPTALSLLLIVVLLVSLAIQLRLRRAKRLSAS